MNRNSDFIDQGVVSLCSFCCRRGSLSVELSRSVSALLTNSAWEVSTLSLQISSCHKIDSLGIVECSLTEYYGNIETSSHICLVNIDLPNKDALRSSMYIQYNDTLAY